MAEEFVPYERALKLKELGFDEPCLLSWNLYTHEVNFNGQPSKFTSEDVIQLPTFSQAFRWFREKYSLCIVIKPIDDKKLELGYNLTKNGLIMGAYTTYEKAEQACLDKLIELTFKSE